MPRTRTAATRSQSGSRAATIPTSLTQAAERMIDQIRELVAEIASLRADNAALRAELREAVDFMERASAAMGTRPARASTVSRTGARRRVADEAAAAPTRARAAAPARSRGRATPDSVTSDVVRAAIGKLGTATAKEIATEIGRAGVTVSGRAIRFLAPAAGARVEVVDGQRRYRL